MMEDIQQQLIRDLVVESSEGLDQFDRDLLALESGTADEETLHSIFRTVHTIKGSSGCLGLRRIERVAHAGENLLSLMRDGRIVAGPELLAKLFRYSDALRGMLRAVGEGGAEPTDDNASLIADLNALHEAAARAEESMQAGSSGLFSDEDDEPLSAFDSSETAESSLPEQSQAELPVATAAAPPAACFTTRCSSDGNGHTRGRRPTRHLDGFGGRTGLMPQSDSAICGQLRRNGFPAIRPATEHHHEQAAGKRHEDPHAACRQRLG